MSTENTTPAGIEEMQREYSSIVTELEKAQEDMAAGKSLDQNRGDDIAKKAQRAVALQKQLDAYKNVQNALKGSGELLSLTMPAAKGKQTPKGLRTTPGHLFVTSQEFAEYKRAGKRDWSARVAVQNTEGRPILLSGEAAEAFRVAAGKANIDYNSSTQLSTQGIADLTESTVDPDVVRSAERRALTLRSVIGSLPTSSDSVKYMKYTFTPGAAAQNGKGGVKAFGKVVGDSATVNVETVAVLTKITEQDIDDAPRLVGIVNEELAADVEEEIERQILWGSGASGEVAGLFDDSVAMSQFARHQAEDTPIDTVRRMITDLQTANVQPDFFGTTPLVWELIELAKGSDQRYVWAVIRDALGARIWSLPAVVTNAFYDGDNTEHRMLVGNGKRGATLYQHTSGPRLAVGLMEDDFARNLRTLRAENRVALAVKRPWNFLYDIATIPEQS